MYIYLFNQYLSTYLVIKLHRPSFFVINITHVGAINVVPLSSSDKTNHFLKSVHFCLP